MNKNKFAFVIILGVVLTISLVMDSISDDQCDGYVTSVEGGIIPTGPVGPNELIFQKAWNWSDKNLLPSKISVTYVGVENGMLILKEDWRVETGLSWVEDKRAGKSVGSETFKLPLNAAKIAYFETGGFYYGDYSTFDSYEEYNANRSADQVDNSLRNQYDVYGHGYCYWGGDMLLIIVVDQESHVTVQELKFYPEPKR